jgi:predicted unusual protein kinase regulating ubiquinone biosynthesis (AarF/ABC1/UbiB family)
MQPLSPIDHRSWVTYAAGMRLIFALSHRIPRGQGPAPRANHHARRLRAGVTGGARGGQIGWTSGRAGLVEVTDYPGDGVREDYSIMASERPIPESRISRLAHLGRLAGGIAGGVLGAGARQLGQGKRPSFGDLLITPENARRLADRLSEMRGAAMKVGQLLSMESGELLPPELSQALSRLRESAHFMPLGQVARALDHAWGPDWQKQFRRFAFTPIAAASIGQVHAAELRDGTRLAVKIQYPGIRKSIDSDVDNVGALLRLVSLIPRQIDFRPLLAEAKRQLHAEADYLREAESLRRFARRLAGDSRFAVPAVIEGLTTPEVLTMTYLDGEPIESLLDAPVSERNAAASALLELALREVLDWGLVQTDPNFANFRYRASDGQLQLLDFGATREYPAGRHQTFRDLMRASIEGDERAMTRAAVSVGYIAEEDPGAYRASTLALLRAVAEPARTPGVYDFGSADLAARIGEMLVKLRLREKFSRIPPPDVLFLHRKLGGLYLLLTRLRARLDVHSLVAPFLHRADDGEVMPPASGETPRSPSAPSGTVIADEAATAQCRTQPNGHGVGATAENVSRCRADRSRRPDPLPEGAGDAEHAVRDFRGKTSFAADAGLSLALQE